MSKVLDPIEESNPRNNKQQWPHVLLGEIAKKIGSGTTPRGGDAVYIDSGVALIRSQNIYNGQFTHEGLAFIDNEQAERMQGVEVLLNDVLLNITGDSVARCGIMQIDNFPARVNQHVSIIRPEENRLHPRFLMYFLISPYMQSYMLSLAGSGGTRKALTKAMIEKFLIPCPKINIQEKVISILSAYDDLIENNRRRIALLEQAARLLYQEWFVRFRFPGHEHARLVDGLPEGWERVPLSQICDDIRETIKPEQVAANTPYIGLEHIPRKSITLYNWGLAEAVTSNKFKYLEGDILFGKIRPYFHKVGVTFTDGITSSDAIVIRTKDIKFHSFLLMLVSSDGFVNIASKTAKEGSKMPRADWNHLKNYPVSLPPLAILTTFNSSICPIVTQLKNLALHNKALEHARDILLPRLMNGEVEV